MEHDSRKAETSRVGVKILGEERYAFSETALRKSGPYGAVEIMCVFL